MYDPSKSVRPYKRVLTPRMQEDNSAMNEKTEVQMEVQKRTPKTAIVVYRPDHDQPPEIMMFATETKPGISFKANDPVEIPYSRTTQQLLVEKFETSNGIRSRAMERLIPIIDVLRGNPSFEVDGERPERIKPHARLPQTSDEYRGFCINWISVSMSADWMDKRWVGEEGLRQRCGCAPSDIAYLRPFFDARRVECAELDQQRRNVA